MDSSVGLAIQWIGTSLIALLSFFTLRSLSGTSTKYWTIAWTCLSIALGSLFAGFQSQGKVQQVFYSLYFFGEYAFGLMFIAGCRNHARGARITRSYVRVFIPFVLMAGVLPYVSRDFNNLFIVQAAIMAALFAIALYALAPARRENPTPGVSVMSVALFLLALDFLQYVPVFGLHLSAWGWRLPEFYFRYNSFVDLILEILLGFGTIMVVMEAVRKEVEVMNRELTAARDRLEEIARVDPLTQALTRHAFYSLFSSHDKGQTGCAVVIDMDNLKPINDSHGHGAGDAAIRAVAHAVRTVTRAEDMLFRWGGDEFLVLMFGITEQLARQRLGSLNALLTETGLPNMASSLEIRVSYGLSSFHGMADLHQAIERADEAMYKSKQVNKTHSATRML
jgi:diguanylate cyclase